MRAIAQDIRAAVVALARQPACTAVAVMIVALGIGANTAVFSVLDAVLLRPLPYQNAERLFLTGGRASDMFVERRAYRNWDFAVLPEMADGALFDGVAVASSGEVTLGGTTSDRVRAAAVSGEFFSVLGVQPLVGRLLTDRDAADRSTVAVISEGLWRSRFAARTDVAGQSVLVNGRPFMITGVLPGAVQVPDAPEVWIPSGIDSQLVGETVQYEVLIRVRPGVPLSDVRTELQRIAAERFPRVPGIESSVWIQPLREALSQPVRPVLVLIAASAFIVLLVSCLNIAGLLLIRVSRRERELAIRHALGASPWRLARYVLLESVVLSLAGAGLAALTAQWLVAAARQLLPPGVHGAAVVTVDHRAFAAMALLALITGVVSGIVPALSPGLSSWPGIGKKARSRTAMSMSAPPRPRLRRILVVAQIAAALALLVSASTIARKVHDVLGVEVGVRGNQVLVMQLELPRGKYRSPEQVRAFYDELEKAFSSVPGVAHAGITNYVPGTRIGGMRIPIHVEGVPRPTARALEFRASPGYFSAIGIDLLAGRQLNSGEGDRTPTVAIVTSGVAKAVGVAPVDLVGRRLDLTPTLPYSTWAEIVGVAVRDLRTQGEAEAQPAVFLPLASPPPQWSTHAVVHSVGNLEPLIPQLRQAVAGLDPDVPLFNVMSFDEARAALLAERRMAMFLLLALGGIAAVQALVGLYALLSHGVQARTREFGIRLALGESPHRMQRALLLHAAALGGGGIGLGAMAAFAAWSIVSTRIPALGDLQLANLIAVSGVILSVTLAASWLPARRASQADPLLVLRTD